MLHRIAIYDVFKGLHGFTFVDLWLSFQPRFCMRPFEVYPRRSREKDDVERKSKSGRAGDTLAEKRLDVWQNGTRM